MVAHAIISDQLIIKALNTGPNGGVYQWRDNMMKDFYQQAMFIAPVNDPDNAIHRGRVVGTYRAGLRWDRRGSNQHNVRGRLRATARHSYWVEFGRQPALKTYQRFSWTGFRILYNDPGPFAVENTSGYEGRRVLRRTFNSLATQRNIHEEANRVGK